ncbi:PIN domain-containing protein [Aeropyrum camini]|uniref:Predicted nucleic acid-binding protein n=1 Tax=Aeropyrum camini SY1 = JCM 12091 TaxID=1198449 RepID=U3T847_9CREN|nr:PIN domain-containing protein [Aeropyrum camini]BAN89682.1 predicted nucleic acid-binding protein [Aeropyrum camini SY1 = JCM 12091]
MKTAYIDTSIILSILLETEKSDLAEQTIERYSDWKFVISGVAVNEAIYVATYEYYKQKGEIKGKYSLRKLIKQQGYPNKVITLIDSILKDLDVEIIGDYFNNQDYIKTLLDYKLLPNDAQITLTCKHYGIDTILTFDEDFRRVPWLKVIP